jgi:hypothetical protein
MAVSLSDEYVLLLQSVVEENKLLREELKKSVEDTKLSIQGMKTKVEKINNISVGARKVRQTGPVRAVRAPKLCRVSVH